MASKKHKFLDVTIYFKSNSNQYTVTITNKLRGVSFAMSILAQHTSFETNKVVYFVYVESTFSHGIVLWRGSSDSKIFHDSEKIIISKFWNSSKIITLLCLYISKILIYIHACSDYFDHFIYNFNYNTRQQIAC